MIWCAQHCLTHCKRLGAIAQLWAQWFVEKFVYALGMGQVQIAPPIVLRSVIGGIVVNDLVVQAAFVDYRLTGSG